jgi:predicted PurR-regulated permease PerM
VARVLQAACILALLAVFFAYLLAPVVDAVRRRIRIDHRGRPLSRTSAILLLYFVLFVPGALAWRRATGPIDTWVHVTAPASIARIFATTGRLPGVDGRAARATTAFFSYVEGHLEAAIDDVVGAARYVKWLAAVPLLAFLLLAYAPSFRRSALRVLPHGHLQWRGDEYLRDVNSALAGYIRAQLAAGAISAVVCAAAFWLFQLPSAFSLGVLAGILELVPVIGPLTVMVMAAAETERHVLAVLAFLIVFRGVQDYVVYPRLIRRGMHLSSVAVIVSIWCGAALNGAAGVVLAIPVAGFLSVSFRHWREYRAIERLVRTAGDSTR